MEKKLTRRKAQAIETKQLLFKKAISLFAKKGYHAVTVDEICEKCNVSKGAFYTHFSSKHDIIIEQSKNSDSAHLEFFSQLPEQLSSEEKMRRFVSFIGENIADQKGFEIQQIIYSAELSARAKPGYITDQSRPIYTCIKAIVEEGQQRGEFRTDLSADAVCASLICCIRGGIYEWLINSGQCDLQQIESSVISLLIEGLK